MECLLPYFNMVTVPHETVGLERFHCIMIFPDKKWYKWFKSNYN